MFSAIYPLMISMCNVGGEAMWPISLIVLLVLQVVV